MAQKRQKPDPHFSRWGPDYEIDTSFGGMDNKYSNASIPEGIELLKGDIKDLATDYWESTKMEEGEWGKLPPLIGLHAGILRLLQPIKGLYDLEKKTGGLGVSLFKTIAGDKSRRAFLQNMIGNTKRFKDAQFKQMMKDAAEAGKRKAYKFPDMSKGSKAYKELEKEIAEIFSKTSTKHAEGGRAGFDEGGSTQKEIDKALVAIEKLKPGLMPESYEALIEIYKDKQKELDIGIMESAGGLGELLGEGGRAGFKKGSMRERLQKDYKSYAKFSDLLKTAPPNFWLSPEKYGMTRDDAMTYLKERFMYGDLDKVSSPAEIFKNSPELVKFKKWWAEREDKASGGRAGFQGGGTSIRKYEIPPKALPLIQEMYEKAGGRGQTGLSLKEFAFTYFGKKKGGRIGMAEGMSPSERWMRDYFYDGKGGYDNRMSFKQFQMGPGVDLWNKHSGKAKGGRIGFQRAGLATFPRTRKVKPGYDQEFTLQKGVSAAPIKQSTVWEEILGGGILGIGASKLLKNKDKPVTKKTKESKIPETTPPEDKGPDLVPEIVAEVAIEKYLEELDKRIMDEMELTKTEMDNMSSVALDDLRRNADPHGMYKHFDEITPGRGVGDFADDPDFLKDDYASGGIENIKNITPEIDKLPAPQKLLEDLVDVKERKWDSKTGKETSTWKTYKRSDKTRPPTEEELEDDYAELWSDEQDPWDFGSTIEELDAALEEQRSYERYMYDQYKTGKLDKYMSMDAKLERVLDADDADRPSGYDPDEEDEIRAHGEEKERLAIAKMNEAEEIARGKASGSPWYTDPKTLTPEEELRKEFPGLDDRLIKQILTDKNPQRIADVKQSMRDALKMREKGISPDDIIKTFKDTSRKKNAAGGPVGWPPVQFNPEQQPPFQGPPAPKKIPSPILKPPTERPDEGPRPKDPFYDRPHWQWGVGFGTRAGPEHVPGTILSEDRGGIRSVKPDLSDPRLQLERHNPGQPSKFGINIGKDNVGFKYIRKFDQGGIARRPNAVPPLSGPTPQGLTFLLGDDIVKSRIK